MDGSVDVLRCGCLTSISRAERPTPNSMRAVTEKARCVQCREPMRILVEIRVSGVFGIDMGKLYELTGQGKSALRCGACKRYYCWDCSDSTESCKCGATSWQGPHEYYSEDPEPPLLFDKTGRANLFGMYGGRTLYLTPGQAGLPNDIDIRELNLYQKERTRDTTKSAFWRLFAPTAAIGFALWLAIVKLFGPGFWPIVAAIVGSIISFRAITFITFYFIARSGVLYACPNGHSIRVSSKSPSSAWQCVECGFNHFKYWRARRFGPGDAVLGDGEARRQKAEELWFHGKKLLRQNHYQEAKDVIKEAIELWPDYPDLYDDLGLCYSRLGDHEHALQASDRAIQLNPTEPRLYTNRGARLLRRGDQGDIAKAKECATKALDIEPKFKSAHKLIRDVAKAQSNLDDTKRAD